MHEEGDGGEMGCMVKVAELVVVMMVMGASWG